MEGLGTAGPFGSKVFGYFSEPCCKFVDRMFLSPRNKQGIVAGAETFSALVRAFNEASHSE
jgi:hypothetical protein